MAGIRCKELHAAKTAGEMFYFTGKPCKHGHISKRYTATQICHECGRTVHYPKDRDAYRFGDTFYRQFCQRRSEANRHNIPFTIQFEDLAQPTHCPILGLKLNYNWSGPNRRDPAKASLDKLIPSLGYVLGNVYVISWRANRLKSSATIDELEKIIGYIKERQNETV